MQHPSTSHRRLTALAAVAGLAVTLAVAPASPAAAADLFTEDFQQPSVQVWQTAGALFHRVDGGDSIVYEQPDASRDGTAITVSGVAPAPSGSASQLTVRVKPAAALGEAARIGVVGRALQWNTHYYAVLRAGTLEIGTRYWGEVTPLAATPFAATPGGWHTVSLRFGDATALPPATPAPEPDGTVSAVVTGPDGATATVTAADPGTGGFGGRVGVWAQYAAGAFDDLVYADGSVPTPPDPTAPCPALIRFAVTASWPGSFLASVTLTNTGVEPVGPGWTVRWRFTDGQRISTLFRAGRWEQRGSVVTVTNPVWSTTIPPGSSVDFGFNATGQSSAYPQADVTVNGIPCP